MRIKTGSIKIQVAQQVKSNKNREKKCYKCDRIFMFTKVAKKQPRQAWKMYQNC